MKEVPNHQSVLSFWFQEIRPSQWWKQDVEFDRLIAARFGEVHARAGRCELFGWRKSARGRLAEIIVLDQFSRNIHRDTPLAFANDALALGLAQEAIGAGADRLLEANEKSFLYMPFMHSESKAIHHIANVLFQQVGLDSSWDFELKHKQIIERFGRYPHRNAILGRASTEAEIEFLERPDSSF